MNYRVVGGSQIFSVRSKRHHCGLFLLANCCIEYHIEYFCLFLGILKRRVFFVVVETKTHLLLDKLCFVLSTDCVILCGGLIILMCFVFLSSASAL